MPEENRKPDMGDDATTTLPVTEALVKRIAAEGPITVADYMAAAARYYYANKTAFGRAGDFITAPEISQMFGEMIGAWFVDIWLQTGQPDKVRLIELGPGRGTLMADIMRTISAWPDLNSAVSIHLVESSPQLRQEQSDMLKAYRPTWYDDISEIPEGYSFIVSNEFLDALPIHQFKKTVDGWMERRIDYDADEGHFKFTATTPDFDVAQIMPPVFLAAPENAIFEISPASLSVIEQVAKRIAAQGGAALMVDYGYTVSGLGDTLQSVLKHNYADVLENPGSRDITAHVDFATLKTVAEQHVRVHGAVPQGEFLLALGIKERAEKLIEDANDEQRADILSALYRLTAPMEMGRLFKVMGMTREDYDIRPAGFDSGHDDGEENDGDEEHTDGA